MNAPGRRAALAVLGLIGIWLVAWCGRVVYLGMTRGTTLPAYHDPEGYRETAELYTHHGWLRYEPTTRTIELDPKYRGTPIEELYLRSHLAGDVADFNAGERAIFSVENDQIFGLDPSRHRIALPFSESRSWTGALTYRPTKTRIAELRGGGTAIELVGPTTPLRGMENPPEIILRSGSDDGAKGNAPGAAHAARAVRAEKVKLTGRGGAFLGTVNRIGDALLFNHRSQAAGVEVSVSGDEVRQGTHARLDSGDLLKLRWRLGSRGSQYALLWSSVLGEAPPISVYRPINGRFRRIPERPDPPFAGDVLAAIDTALHRPPGEAPVVGSERFDLALTLDSGLEAEVQRQLEAYAQGLRGRTGAPFRAAVTVMDATNGELLALASYPTAEQLGSYGDGDRSRERWLRNHNFSRLPIGSVAKIPFAAAILDRAPFLAGLRIRGYAEGKFTQLLGLALDPPLEDHAIGGGEDGWIDFDEFIQHSSNKYGATLLTLATGVDEAGPGLLPPAGDPDVPDQLDPEERFAIGGEIYDRRPGLNLPIVANRNAKDPELARLAACGRIITLEHRDFAASLRRLFDVPFTTKHSATRWPAGDGDDLIDTSIWRPVLTQLYGDQLPRETTFRGASPERENLALNLIDDYRREYLSLVLGGGESTWTMPRIASVFSRLVTGKRIEPRLVRRVHPEGEEPAAATAGDKSKEKLADLDLRPETRQRIADAMTLVAGPGGTASALSPQLRALDRRLAARGEVLGFFSKTGSPDNSTYVSTSLARALDTLIARRALTLDAADRIVYRDSGPVDADRTEEGRATRSLEALQANPGDLQVLRRYGVGPRSIIQACDTWNDSRPEDRVQFERRGGRLVRALRRREIEAVGAAYVFTIGAWDAAARRGEAEPPRVDVVGHSPKRALTVAIIIEGQGKGPTIAVPFAGKLIQEVLVDALDTGW
ncbi:MAG TPA: hypothetical protein VGS22_16080 [Thermoanaerobaculia bacterium]|jgi:hypothetical protein|nr:hypothetical protein [Thermoanaerobaculia bacterium]